MVAGSQFGRMNIRGNQQSRELRFRAGTIRLGHFSVPAYKFIALYGVVPIYTGRLLDPPSITDSSVHGMAKFS